MSAVALLLLLVSPLVIRRYSAKCLYIAWVVVLVGFLIPVRPQPTKPAIQVMMPPVTVQQTPVFTIAPQVQAPTEAPSPMELETLVTPSKSPAKFSLTVGQILFTIWALGAAGTFAFQMYRHGRFMRTVRRWSKPVTEDAYLSMLETTKEELGIRSDIRLKTCRPIDSPMLVGLLRPVVLLPDMRMSPAELCLVLRHELVHFRRGDLWGKVLLLLASAAHWFNPLMPLISREMCFQCEVSCDAEVVKGSDFETRRYYSETIIGLIRSRVSVGTALSTRYYGGKNTMKRRILRILDLKGKRLGVIVVATIALLVLVGGMTFALGTEEGTLVSLPYSTIDDGTFWSMTPGELDDAAIWDILMQPIVVYDGGLDTKPQVHAWMMENPDGTGVQIAQLHAQSQGLHVIGEPNEHGYVLVEAFSNYDESYNPSTEDEIAHAYDIKHGYVLAKNLKTVEVMTDMALVIDKKTQRMYLFKDGERVTELLIATGLVSDEKFYNETIAGEYITIGHMGAFTFGNMICDMAIRINGGILIHEVPYTLHTDGSHDYSSFEGFLGTKQSQGCIRVQYLKNDDGYNMRWIWDNFQRGKSYKVIIWDDLNRADSPGTWYPSPEG